MAPTCLQLVYSKLWICLQQVVDLSTTCCGQIHSKSVRCSLEQTNPQLVYSIYYVAANHSGRLAHVTRRKVYIRLSVKFDHDRLLRQVFFYELSYARTTLCVRDILCHTQSSSMHPQLQLQCHVLYGFPFSALSERFFPLQIWLYLRIWPHVTRLCRYIGPPWINVAFL